MQPEFLGQKIQKLPVEWIVHPSSIKAQGCYRDRAQEDPEKYQIFVSEMKSQNSGYQPLVKGEQFYPKFRQSVFMRKNSYLRTSQLFFGDSDINQNIIAPIKKNRSKTSNFQNQINNYQIKETQTQQARQVTEIGIQFKFQENHQLDSQNESLISQQQQVSVDSILIQREQSHTLFQQMFNQFYKQVYPGHQNIQSARNSHLTEKQIKSIPTQTQNEGSVQTIQKNQPLYKKMFKTNFSKPQTVQSCQIKEENKRSFQTLNTQNQEKAQMEDIQNNPLQNSILQGTRPRKIIKFDKQILEQKNICKPIITKQNNLISTNSTMANNQNSFFNQMNQYSNFNKMKSLIGNQKQEINNQQFKFDTNRIVRSNSVIAQPFCLIGTQQRYNTSNYATPRARDIKKTETQYTQSSNHENFYFSNCFNRMSFSIKQNDIDFGSLTNRSNFTVKNSIFKRNISYNQQKI